MSTRKLSGVAPLLDVNDMVETSNPDWKSVFTYVNTIYTETSKDRQCQRNSDLEMDTQHQENCDAEPEDSRHRRNSDMEPEDSRHQRNSNTEQETVEPEDE